jgi:hypothetical protein
MRGLPKGPFLEWLEGRRHDGYSTNEIARLTEPEHPDALARQLYRVEHEPGYALTPSLAEQVLFAVDHGATMLYDLWPRRYREGNQYRRRRQTAA